LKLKGRTGKKANGSKRLELVLGETPEFVCAYYLGKEGKILLNARDLMSDVASRVQDAKEAGVDLGDVETVWICKFSSLISHEILHHVLAKLEGDLTSRKLDTLSSTILSVFLEDEKDSDKPWMTRDKSFMAMCDMMFWTDAFNSNPLGDTWFS